MTRPTSRQYSCIWIAIKALKWSEDAKEELVISYTKDAAKKSLTDLTFDQAEDMKNFLNNLISPSTAKPVKNTDADKIACNNIRRGILSVCHKLQWYVRDEAGALILKDGDPKLDYAVIDKFCMERTAAHKKLNEMNKDELQKARYQFDQTYKNYLNKPI